MSKKIQLAALKLCWHALVPLAQILIRFGIGHRDFVDVSRSAFVLAASQELRSSNKRVTSSKISARTGLSRKDISKIRDEGRLSFKDFRGCLAITDVLSEWGSSSDYMDDTGSPVRLPLRSDAGQSIEKLVETVAPNATANTVVKELMDIGCVVKVGREFKLVSRQFVPSSMEPRMLELAGRAMFALGSTIAANLSVSDPELKYFERMAVSTKLKSQAIPRFLSQVSENSRNLLEIADDWIVSNENRSSDSDATRFSGVGVYSFDVENFVDLSDLNENFDD